jgi:ribosome recycling factor
MHLTRITLQSITLALTIRSTLLALCEAWILPGSSTRMSFRCAAPLDPICINPHQFIVSEYHHRHNRYSRKVVLYLSEAVEEITMDTEDRMDKSINSLKVTLTSIRTGRATASMLDRVKVNYYGADTPLYQMATISVPSAQQLQIDPFDKSVTKDIEKAIIESDLGLTPNNNGSVIRINIPPLTEQRRKELLKQCKALGEEGKVAIRNIRRNAVDDIKKVEKSGDIGEDEMKDGLDAIQKLTDQHAKAIDEIVAMKEKEVMTV